LKRLSSLPEWRFCLYVDGALSSAASAFHNLTKMCEAHLAGRYQIDVVDVSKNPHLARTQQIVALPTVVRKGPLPVRKIIGDLSNAASALAALDISPDSAVQQTCEDANAKWA
jgi:circadian clock protein KaiB